MGYYTQYNLHINPSPSQELLDFEVYETRIEELLDEGFNDKWYDHDEDMLNLSLSFPEYVFILDGEGEESGDVWRSFYKNGKDYTWRLDYELPDFEEEKLQ